MSLLRALWQLLDEVWGLGALFDALRNAHGYFAWDLALRGIAAAFLVGSVALVSLRVSRWLVPQAGLPLRWSTTFSAGMWLSTAGFHALRELRGFTLGWALLACAALLALALRAWPERSPLAYCVRRELRAFRAFARLLRHSRQLALWAVFGFFALLLGLRGFVIPPLGWDTLTYHGPRAAQFVASGKFTFDPGVGGFDFYRHFFAGGEVLSAWAMLPFHSDLFANLASFVQWIGLGLSGWALARALGLREPFGSTSACVLMFVPTLQLEVNSGYVEVVLNAALLHGIAAALSCMRRPSLGLCLTAALSLGVATGIKLPGAPPAAIVLAVLWLRLLPARGLDLRGKAIGLGASALLALLPAAPWMFRAYRDTGYPLSPMPAKLFGVTLGVASHTMRWYGDRPEIRALEWEAEKGVLGIVFSALAKMNETLGSLALIFVLVFPIGLCVLARRRPWTALAVTLAVIAPVLAYYSAGFAPVRMVRAPSSTRFLIPAFALIVPISLIWCRRAGPAISRRRYAAAPLSAAYRGLLVAYALIYAVLCMRRGWVDWETREIVIVGLWLGFLVAGTRWLARSHPLRALSFATLGFCWFCAGLQLRRDETRPAAYSHSFALHGLSRFWVEGVAHVDEPGRPHRIAITGGPDHASDKWFQYFYLGKRFENELRYVVPTRDGKVAYYVNDNDLETRADRDSWLKRLDQGGFQEVLTFPPRSIEQGWMEEQADRFEKLAGNEKWGLFRIRR
ncbi:MAG TPA: hypothetical protein VJV78_13835 [Polyangiales bacterium]|nr:hypothetical protein [Polyangiales bacterium]